MSNTIERLERDYCTGCEGCKSVCPTNAIAMEIDEKGFWFPQVDAELCVHCEKCVNVCVEMNHTLRESYYQEGSLYAAIINDEEIHLKSSSGGVFTVLAKYILEQGGVVAGAAFDDSYRGVEHVVIDSIEDLGRLRGSKYLQSRIGEVYKKLSGELRKGRPVLFSGCPCQVAGFKSYLGKDYPLLFTCDIICHGVPSPLIYRKYLDEKAKGRKIKKVDFREKKHFGWGTASSLFFEDGSVYRGDCFNDIYMRTFLEGFSMRACCGSCKYTTPLRVGDVTLGDFWGVAEIDESLYDKKGVSVVSVNNDKAKELLISVADNFKIWREINKEAFIELAKTRNGYYVHPTGLHWARARFFELSENRGLEKAYSEAKNSKYDVGIVGWWFHENYGGTLTYYALHQVLKKMGLSVLMIAKRHNDPNYRPNTKTVPYRFALKNYYISKTYNSSNISILNNHCKTFISGSDQLFNPVLWPYSGSEYFLDFASSKNNIVSYASSFGNKFHDNQGLKDSMSYWLHRFNSLSVRENYGVTICQEEFGLTAKMVLDPVFLCDLEEYQRQADQANKTKDENFFVSFMLDPNSEKREALLYIREKLGFTSVNLLNAIDFERNTNALNLDNTKPNIDVEEWLYYYMNADFVVTDSFHGTCFAILFRKDFISIANYQRGEKRFISILETAGLLERLVHHPEEIRDREDLFSPIDYDVVFEKLNPFIKESYEWLENAIKNPREREKSDFNMIETELERLKRRIEELERAKG